MTPDPAALDPRAKLAFALSVSAIAIAIPRLSALAALGSVMLLTVAVGATPSFREWLGSLSPLAVIVPIILVLNAFFYGGGAVLWRAPVVPLSLTVGGIEHSAVIVGRLVVIAGVASWVALTTGAEEFEAALASVGVPWGFAFLCSLTIRLVPELRARFRTIEEAQRSRGLEMDGGPLARARARIPMLVPFLVSVVESGYELSDALTVRGFGRTEQRTSVIRLEHGRGDYALYGFSAALVVAFVGVFVV